MELFL